MRAGNGQSDGKTKMPPPTLSTLPFCTNFIDGSPFKMALAGMWISGDEKAQNALCPFIAAHPGGVGNAVKVMTKSLYIKVLTKEGKRNSFACISIQTYHSTKQPELQGVLAGILHSVGEKGSLPSAIHRRQALGGCSVFRLRLPRLRLPLPEGRRLPQSRWGTRGFPAQRGR